MKRLAYSKQFLGLALIATMMLLPLAAHVPKAEAAYTYVSDDLNSVIGWSDVKQVGWDFLPNLLLLTIQYQTNIPNNHDYRFRGWIYLDTDQNSGTGNSGGYDYEVYYFVYGDGVGSYGYVYHWDTGSAQWVSIKYITPSSSPGGDTVELGVLLSDIGSPTAINVYLNSDCYLYDNVKKKYSYDTASPDRSITVDGTSSDWTDAMPVVTDSTGDGVPSWADATTFYTADNAGKLYMRMDLAATPPTLHPEEQSFLGQQEYVYLDTDHNSGTGESDGGIGADYYLYVTLYTYHASQTGWIYLYSWSGSAWTTVSSATLERAFSTCLECSLLLSDMGVSGSVIDIYVDRVYSGSVDRVPNSGTFTATKGANPPVRTLNEASAQILSAAANNVYFIYADPYRMVSSTADWSAAFAAYDATASGLIYGLCTSEQRIVYDSDPSMVITKISSGNPFNYGKVLLSSKSIVVMGGPLPNWVVDYYERTGQTPLKFNGVDGFATQTGTTVASLPAGTDMKHNDLFVVETFQDTNGNYVLIIYGLGWKGTFAGGVYFKEHIKPILTSYTSSFYIFTWTDSGGMDGVPQASEITPVMIT